MERQTEVRPSNALRVAGLLSAAIYLVLSGRLSWWRYGEVLESWANLLGAGRATAAICLVGIGILMALYLWGLRSVRIGGVQRRTIWAFAFIFAGTLLWLLPITSDLFVYLSHAHMLTDLGANPLLQAPLDFHDSFVVSYPTVYAARPSVYGPAWVLLSAIGTIGSHDVPVGLFYLKGLAAVAYLGGAWLIERVLLEFRPEVALEGLYLFAWNPFVLLMAVGDGHNDMVMMALALLSIWLLLKERWVLAFGALALSVWIKYLSFALVPLIGIYVWRRLGRGQQGNLRRPIDASTELESRGCWHACFAPGCRVASFSPCLRRPSCAGPARKRCFPTAGECRFLGAVACLPLGGSTKPALASALACRPGGSIGLPMGGARDGGAIRAHASRAGRGRMGGAKLSFPSHGVMTKS
jgi:hypothetical protein